ncbi:MAG TPA: hypothetical protein DCE14_07355 [Kosmotogaceae bacterium]|nr:MAG: Uncharacterized protein XE05_0911 [Thermotogales bacterium 46_20]HAA86143.1 hypothetical protein [Kosmotogaceae bacterium]
MGRFSEKVALITGAGSGIGKATALALAREGAQLAIVDIDRDSCDETLKLVKDHSPYSVSFVCDVSKEDEQNTLYLETLKHFEGRLDIAVNNAGIEGAVSKTADYPLAEWNRVLDVNLTGIFIGMKHQIKAMLINGGGSIVNMSSVLGMVAVENFPAYVATKHAIIGLTKAAAVEYAANNIRINAVCPATIETPLVMDRGFRAGQDKAVYDKLVSLHPVGRLGKPEEIASMITWLCSDDSSFVTGAAMIVDGGYTAI